MKGPRTILIKTTLFIALCAAGLQNVHAQLYSDHRIQEQKLVYGLLAGEEMGIRNVAFEGVSDAIGAFKNNNTNLPLDSGIILSTGRIKDVSFQNKSDGMTGLLGGYGDNDLSKLADAPTFDATVLMFDFQPNQDIITFEYVFGSEEYPEYVDKGFNDVFAFFLTDLKTGTTTNLAVLPETNEPVSIDRINHKRYSKFYIDNTDFKPHSIRAKTIEFDGFTKPLLAYAEVVPNRNYRIKIAVADAGDGKLDSGVFLKAGSFISKEKETFYAENKKYFNRFASERKLAEKPEDEPEENTAEKPSGSDREKTKEEPVSNEAPFQFTVYFDFDRDIPAKKELKRFNDALESISSKSVEKIVINGHTDNYGSRNYNDDLSERRARHIRELLKDKGFKGDYEIDFHNFSNPGASNKTDEGRAENRRVEVEIYE